MAKGRNPDRKYTGPPGYWGFSVGLTTPLSKKCYCYRNTDKKTSFTYLCSVINISCTVLGLIWMFCFIETLIYTKGFKRWTMWSEVGSLWSRISYPELWPFWWCPVLLLPQNMPNPFLHLCILLCCYCPLSSSFLTTVHTDRPNWKMPSIC